MRRRTILLVIALLIAAALGARVWFKGKEPTTPQAVPIAAKTSAPATLEFLASEIVTAEPADLKQVMLLTGTLRAVDQVTVKAKVSAEVRAVMVREGEAVKAGQVVVKMDTTEYDARVAQARGNLNNARAQFEIATKTRDKTKKPQLYRVLMLNDDYTPMEFVIHTLQRFFKMDLEQATRVMLHVHQKGVGVCGTFTYEVAETKVNQVIDYARQNQHPLQCTLEKA